MWGAGWPESPTCGFPHPKATTANLEKFLRDQSVYLRQHFRKRETRLPPPPGIRTPTPSMWTPRGSQPGSKATQRPSPTPAKAATPTAHHTGHPGLPSPGRTKCRSPGKVSNALFTRTVAVRTDGTAGAWEGLVGVGSSARSGPGQYPHAAPTSHAQDGAQTQHSPPAVSSYFGKTKNPTPNPQNKNQNSFMKTK